VPFRWNWFASRYSSAPPLSRNGIMHRVTSLFSASRSISTVYGILICCLLLIGCNRAYYRVTADQEAYDLINEKTYDPRWALDDFGIEVSPESRMFDPFDPDRPPIPPDDPESHHLMHWVDGKPGFPGWSMNGSTVHVQNPDWMKTLPLDENDQLRLSSSEAFRLALTHDTGYQRELETLYLSALDVSAERFRFDTQFFGGYGIDYATDGPAAPGGSSSQMTLSTRNGNSGSMAMRRAFTTGADLVVGFANSLVWQFSGPDNYSSSTLLDFSLVQPLLRRAGRERIMETLTLSERTLLANVRQMERFRRGYYLELMTGFGEQPGPTRRGGFFGSSGLGGFTGVGSGGFGGVGGTSFGGSRSSVAPSNASGYVGLLQAQLNLRNGDASLAALRSSLAQLEAFRDAGRIDFFQVEQLRQRLYSTMSSLLTLRRSYQDGLDRFKSDLGIPPQIDLVIEDDMLDHFNLIDPKIIPLQNGIVSLQEQTGATIISLLPTNEDNQPAPLQWSPTLKAGIEQLRDYAKNLKQIRQQTLEVNVPQAGDDIQRLNARIPDRHEAGQRLTNLFQQRAMSGDDAASLVDLSLFNTTGLENLPLTLTSTLNDIKTRIADQKSVDQLIKDLEQLLAVGDQLQPAQLQTVLETKVFSVLPDQLNVFSADLLELSLVQAEARAESATLVPIEMDADSALEIARENRRDWMNARASLVDAWRLVEFNADSLESNLDIVFSGDVGNVGDHPFNINSSTGNLRAALRWDAPITRLQERNTYRQSLIEYQQARRRYYRFEDAIASGLRAALRQVQLNQVNFELRRTALRVAIKQVQSARLKLQEPPRQNALGQAGTFGPTTAQNLISSLDSLRDAQDDILSVWVNYEVQRAMLDLNLGTMELDAEGEWLDPGPIGHRYGYPTKPEPMDSPTPPSPEELPPVPARDEQPQAP